MIPANGKITVSVDFHQKEKVLFGDNEFLLAKEYSNNRRESMPVCCQVTNGNSLIKDGTFILVHHNRFDEYSAHYLGDNIYSLPYNSSIFARLDTQGNAHSLCNNIIVDYIYPEYKIPVPAHLMQPDKFRYKVLSNGFGFKKGQVIFAYEFSNYEIIYVFKGIEHRVVKIVKTDIVGKVINN